MFLFSGSRVAGVGACHGFRHPRIVLHVVRTFLPFRFVCCFSSKLLLGRARPVKAQGC